MVRIAYAGTWTTLLHTWKDALTRWKLHRRLDIMCRVEVERPGRAWGIVAAPAARFTWPESWIKHSLARQRVAATGRTQWRQWFGIRTLRKRHAR